MRGMPVRFFASSADGANFAITMAVTNPEAPPYLQASMIIVPTDTPGFSVSRKLDKLGVVRVEHNIWDDPGDAQVVRQHANGNETVPTVVIGEQAFVNPSAGELIAYLGVHHPHLLPEGFEAPEPGMASRIVDKVFG